MPLRSHTAVRLAALASFGSGVIHVAVVTDHARVWWVSGAFFALLAVFQLAWGVLAAAVPAVVSAGRLRTVLLASGILVNVSSATLWALTRWVTGEPFGPQAGTELPIGPAGIASTGLEIATIAALGWALAWPSRPHKGGAVALAVGVLLVTAPTAWGVSGALAHDHGAHADDGQPHDDAEPHDNAERHDDRRAPHSPEEGAPGSSPSDSPRPADATWPDDAASPTTEPRRSVEPGSSRRDPAEHADDGHGH